MHLCRLKCEMRVDGNVHDVGVDGTVYGTRFFTPHSLVVSGEEASETENWNLSQMSAPEIVRCIYLTVSILLCFTFNRLVHASWGVSNRFKDMVPLYWTHTCD